MKTPEELIDEYYKIHGPHRRYQSQEYYYLTEKILKQFKCALTQIDERQAVSLMLYFHQKKMDQPFIPVDIERITVRKFIDFPLFKKTAYYSGWLDIRTSPFYETWMYR